MAKKVLRIEKQGADSIIPASLSFVRLLPVGQTLQATSSITITEGVVDRTSAMLVSTTLDSTKISGVIQGGTVGTSYVILFTAITQAYKFLKRVQLEVVVEE